MNQFLRTGGRKEGVAHGFPFIAEVKSEGLTPMGDPVPR
jgi:hypothetical protein